MEARALLASEVNDRVDVPTTQSPADEICVPSNPSCVTECGYPCGSDTQTCTDVEMPQLEWVMFGDSGQRINIAKTKLVAAAVNAVNPDLIINLTTGPGGRFVPSPDDPKVAGPGTTLNHPHRCHSGQALSG